MALSGKQKAFIEAYLGEANFNATQAARIAGYSGDDNTLAQRGYELVRNSKVAEQIKRRLEESAMSANENLMHIGEIARGSIGPSVFFITETVKEIDDDGNEYQVERTRLDWEKIREYGRLVKSVSFTANGPKIELYDRLKALELIGKHHGSFADRIEHTGPEGGPIRFTIDDMTNAGQELTDWQNDRSADPD